MGGYLKAGGGLISISMLLLAAWLQHKSWLDSHIQLDLVLKALEAYEGPYTMPTTIPKVAVGLGGCMDAFIPALELFKALNISPVERHLENFTDDLVPASLDSPANIETTFAYFFAQGAAAERYVSSSYFEQIVATVGRVPSTTWSLGGNAAVMANRFALEGCKVLLGARLTGRLRRLLHDNVTDMNAYTSQEDTHVIMEYKTGDSWGNIVAPRANRFIIHSDRENPMLSALETLKEALPTYRPDLLVVSGLQMMDRYPFKLGQRESRLELLKNMLSFAPLSTRIHFEMASFVDEDLMLGLLKAVIPYTDSIGMNEQELPNLLSVLETGQITDVSSSYPRTATMLEHLRAVWRILCTAPIVGEGRRQISRIHLHTLAYQIIMVKRGTRWTNLRRAVAKSSMAAHRHACGVHGEVDVELSRLLMDDSFAIFTHTNSPRVHFNSTDPLFCWSEGQVDICVAPVLVCTQVKQTAGGGDNISAAGLVPQLLPEDDRPVRRTEA